jgi:hypothetical protein
MQGGGTKTRKMFRSVDHFTVETFKTARSMDREAGSDLGRELRRLCSASGGALVAASGFDAGGEEEQRLLASSRAWLMEARYYLYLARRLGFLEHRRYRQLTSFQDLAVREIEAILQSRKEGGRSCFALESDRKLR